MSNSIYRLRLFDGLLVHGSGRSRLLHDFDEDNPADVEALVASGDGFITLATALDEITESLGLVHGTVRPQLEKLTRTLLYLQRHYTIVRKAADFRQ